MLAPWIGGACSPSDTPPAGKGCRSLLAFWMGGACVGADTEPPSPGFGGGGGTFRQPARTPAPWDDDDLAEILSFITPLL
jgi:hypothetical protein